MGLYLLVGAGIVFALVFTLNNLIKTVVHRSEIGFLDILLTFMTTLIVLAGLIDAQTRSSADANVARAALLTGAGLAAVSLILLPLELLRPERLKGSRGLLGMYSGLLLMAASVGVPYAASTFAAPTISAATVVSVTLDAPIAAPQAAITTATPTATFFPTLTDTPRPTVTPSATRYHFSTPTPTLTPTMPTPCVASVQYNLRLHAAPDVTSDTLLVIPYGTTVDLFGKGPASDNGAQWWFTSYQDKTGWLDGQYLLVSSACDSLPVKETP